MPKYDEYGYEPGILDRIKLERPKSPEQIEREKRAEFSKQFARFCGILSGTGIGRMVD
jgi:hypothetical protein